MEKKILRVAWTVVCVIVTVIVIIAVWDDTSETGVVVTNKVFAGKLIGVTAGSGSTPVLEAVSCEFFVLRNINSKAVLYSLESPKPLGWEHREYFSVGPVEVEGGVWKVESGRDIDLRVTSNKPVEVTFPLVQSQKNGYTLMILVVGALVLFWGYAGTLE